MKTRAIIFPSLFKATNLNDARRAWQDSAQREITFHVQENQE